MKAFDLDAAKRGAAVCTKSGMEVRIICFDRIDSIYPIVGLCRSNDESEFVGSYTTDGRKFCSTTDDRDLMMRDDDYPEKLEKGEYDHIADASKMVEPTIKRNLTTDREYWRWVYVGQAMQGIFAGRNWRSGEMIPDCIGFARNAVELADALIEELEKR